MAGYITRSGGVYLDETGATWVPQRFGADGEELVPSPGSAQSGSVSAQVTDGAGGYEDGQIVLYVGPDEPPAPPTGKTGVWIEQAS